MIVSARRWHFYKEVSFARQISHRHVCRLFAIIAALLVIWVLYRYGLLALMATEFFLHLMVFFSITSDFSAWYATDDVLALVICIALVVFGCYTSLAGEPLFRGALADD